MGTRPCPPCLRPRRTEKEAAVEAPRPVTCTVGMRVLPAQACAGICELEVIWTQRRPWKTGCSQALTKDQANMAARRQPIALAPPAPSTACAPTSPYPLSLFWPFGGIRHPWYGRPPPEGSPVSSWPGPPQQPLALPCHPPSQPAS